MTVRPMRYVALLALLGLGVAAGALLYLQGQGVAPRTLAPFIEKRSSGHNPLITGTGQWLGATLRRIDRGEGRASLLTALGVGAQPAPAADAASPPRTRKLVATVEEARLAIASAAPGEAIVFLPGTYRVRGGIAASRPGRDGAPIVVRAERPGTVTIEFEATEGFKVSAPYWRFENLAVRGACAQPGDCEHAFHVVGDAHHFAAVNNTLSDFNAHFKINGESGLYPDHGLIEANTLGNSAPRHTLNPVTPIDLVAASDWIIQSNLITDFIKADGDRISYGAFAKGAGARTRFERNVVLCEQRLQGEPGLRVGLSFGGGATGKPYCRDKRCITEQEQGVMKANLVASCSDVGIYLNSAADTRVIDNTLVDTAGVQVRFPESSAQVDGNLIDGAIVSRNGGVVRTGDNRATPIAYAYLGYHPVRALFRAPKDFDFGWRDGAAARPSARDGADLCTGSATARKSYGAFEAWRACRR